MKKMKSTSYWAKTYKKYVQNTTNMRILKTLIAWKLKHAKQNWWQIWNQQPKIVKNQLKKTCNRKWKKIVPLCYL